jgi:RNA polymerase sigma-70 factor (ECF subfamily)
MAADVTFERGIAETTLASAASGDAIALGRIVAAYHDDMARLAYVICGDQQMAQDAVQTAWSIAWRKLGTLRDPSRLRPWLMSIAANETRQLLRRQRRLRTIEADVVDIGSGLDDPGERARALDLRQALARLSVEDRTLLAMRHLGGFDSTEIGAVLGISSDAVRSRLTRLVAKLRVELTDD